MEKKLTIIGAGITGLSAAYIAANDGWEVTVLESNAKTGGLMRTFQIGGNRLEHYYHHFFINDEELLWLLGELGIADTLEFRKTTMGIFRNNTIYDFNTPKDLLKFTPMKTIDKARFILSSLYLGKKAKWQDWESAPALDWLYRYAGKRATDSIWKPLLEMKYASRADMVPTAWLVGRLKQRMNSRKGTEEQLGYIRGSLQTLTDALVKRLKSMGVKIILNATVTKLLVKDNTLSGIETPMGEFRNGLFLATLSSTRLASLLSDSAYEYSQNLSRLEYIGAICTILEIDRPLSHIYWLNITDPGFPFAGIIEHTNFISPEEYNGSHIVYLSRNYLQGDPIARASKEEIISQMLEPIKKINRGFNQSWIRNVYCFRSNETAPVGGLKFSQNMPKCETPIRNLYISNLDHIYPDEKSCNNSIRIAAKACRKMGIDSSMVPIGTSLAGQVGMD